MKKKAIIFIVAILATIAAINVNGSNQPTAIGKCSSGGFPCIAVCPICGSTFQGMGSTGGPGVITMCYECNYSLSVGDISEDQEPNLYFYRIN